MTWAPERDTLPPVERPDRAIVTIDGPFRAEGFTFPGCSNWSGGYPQCNRDQTIAEAVGAKLYPGWPVVQVPVAYLGPRP